MSVRNWVGLGLAVLLFLFFGFFIRRGCDITTVWALAFGGGLLFAGILVDPEEFGALVRAWRGVPPEPPAT